MNKLVAVELRQPAHAPRLLAASVLAVLVPVTAQPALGQQAERSGKQVVESVCVRCHAEGLNGAPKIGDKSAWIPRISHGLPLLVLSAIRGHGGMPPRGGVASLTDNEIRGAIVYMFHPVEQPVGGPGMSRRESGATANIAPNHRTVGNMDIYLGIVPARHIRGFPHGSPEQSMHGGAPSGEDYQHVNVTLLDHKRSTPITGAKVDIQVEQPALTAESKALEPMPFGGASYGNYVRMRADTSYRIIVRVRPPGAARPFEVRFEHEH